MVFLIDDRFDIKVGGSLGPKVKAAFTLDPDSDGIAPLKAGQFEEALPCD